MADSMSAAELVVRPYTDSDEAAVVALWRRCDLTGPSDDPQRDIQRKRQSYPELFLVGVRAGEVVATVMAGYDGHRGWINYLAVSPETQQQGIGRQMMAAAEAALERTGCPKINLQVRRSDANAVGFYERLGFAVEDRISMGKRIGRGNQ